MSNESSKNNTRSNDASQTNAAPAAAAPPPEHQHMAIAVANICEILHGSPPEKQRRILNMVHLAMNLGTTTKPAQAQRQQQTNNRGNGNNR